MLRTPRSLNVQAMVDPTGEAIKFSGDGKPRICSTVNGRDAGCCASSTKANANTERLFIGHSLKQRKETTKRGRNTRSTRGTRTGPDLLRLLCFLCSFPFGGAI